MCWALRPNLLIQSERSAGAVPLQRSRWPGNDFERWAPPTRQIRFKAILFLIFILFFSANIGAHAADLSQATTIELSHPSNVRGARILNNGEKMPNSSIMDALKRASYIKHWDRDK